jgi:ketosteroid isomerase-like protein
MSEENLAIARAFMTAYNAKDAEGLIGLLHPDATMTTVSQRGGLPSKRWTHDQIRAYFEQLDEAWVDVQAEIEDYRVHADHVVALGRICGTGRSSGVELNAPIATVFLVKNSQLVQVDSYGDWGEGLKAAGLRE